MSKLHFIDYVKYYWWGDATLLESAGKFLLMDTCHEDGTYVIRYLKDYGVKELDLYVSHDHHDHWGRVVYFINHLKVGKVYLPVDMQGGSTAKKIVAAAKERGTQIIYLKKGSTFTCGTWKFTVVFRRGKGYPNPRSLVTIGEGDGVRYFTAGDLSAEGETDLLASGADIHADIYKFSHHGDGATNSEAVIRKVDPSIAVCNCNGESKSVFRSWADQAYRRAEKYANIYSVRYNGTVILDCRNGVIYPSAERNMVKKTFNGKTMQFCDKAKVLWKGTCLKFEKTDMDLAVEVMLGIHGSGAARKKSLGDRFDAVQKQISVILRDREAYTWAVADYVLKDYAGDGEDRKKLLGDIYTDVQLKVNAVVRAAHMICGPINPYGDGEERREKLEKEGLPYVVVQGYIDRKREKLLR